METTELQLRLVIEFDPALEDPASLLDALEELIGPWSPVGDTGQVTHFADSRGDGGPLDMSLTRR